MAMAGGHAAAWEWQWRQAMLAAAHVRSPVARRGCSSTRLLRRDCRGAPRGQQTPGSLRPPPAAASRCRCLHTVTPLLARFPALQEPAAMNLGGNQDWDTVVLSKKRPNAAAAQKPSNVNAAIRAGVWRLGGYRCV